jgi:hypothetical protein
VTPGTADIITDFNGGTRGQGVANGTGDTFLFNGLAAGSVSNYAEQTATSYGAAQSQANGLFTTNSALKYVAVQVGSDTYVFAEHTPSAGADEVVFLQGVQLTGIDAMSFLNGSVST